MAQGATNHPDRRLDSWKEIAAFFGRDERTVRRWEKESALPVHRVPGGAKGRVFAYEAELNQWLSTPQAQRNTTLELDPEVGALLSPLQVSPLQTSQLENQGKHWHLGTPAMLVGTLAVCAALAVGIWVYRKNHRFAAYASAPSASRVHAEETTGALDPRIGPDSVAVLPFTNVRRDATTDYLSDGITESLIGSLAHLPNLRVRSRDSVFRYKGKDIDVQTAGHNLGVSLLVSGRVLIKNDTIEISTELTNVRYNAELWGHRYTGKTSDLVSLQRQMSADIAESLRSSLNRTDKLQVAQQGTQDPEAYSLYLKGRYAWNKRTLVDLMTAVSYYNQAIAKDPGYALAYSGIAEVYSVGHFYGVNSSDAFPKSNAAARKALELDPTLARPHAVLGQNEMEYDWDFAGGESEFKKAIELDPNDPTTHQWYSEKLSALGRHREAIAEVNRARELDPQSPVITRVLGGNLDYAGQHDRGIAVCKQLTQDNPTFAIAHDCLFYAYWHKHMYPEAVEEWSTYSRLSGQSNVIEAAAALEHGFRAGGWPQALTEVISVFENRRKNGGYSSPFEIARLYADHGDKEKAFEWLETAYREHDSLLIGLNVQPQFDSIRSDPRFTELADKIGLPKLL